MDALTVADVFISYAHQDGPVVKELAPALEAAGYSTWYYEDKGAVGASYLLQIDQEIERCHAVLVLISPESVGSDQVSKEVIRAHEARKKFVPVRRGITHEEFQKRQPEWRMAFGAAVSAEVPEGGARAIAPRIVEGLRRLGVEPGGPPALPSSPLRRLSRAATRGTGAKDAGLGAGVALVVAALGILFSLFSLIRTLSPVARSPEAWVVGAFPGFRNATLFVNAVGAALSALAFSAALRVRRGERAAGLTVRNAALWILVSVGVWLAVSLTQFSGADAQARIPDPAARSALVQQTWTVGLSGLVPWGLVFALFRRSGPESS